jgi:hypothetical protein
MLAKSQQRLAEDFKQVGHPVKPRGGLTAACQWGLCFGLSEAYTVIDYMSSEMYG